MMWLLGAALSFVLDLLLGDPEKLLHPVVVMGKAISRLEKILRAGFPKRRGENGRRALSWRCSCRWGRWR